MTLWQWSGLMLAAVLVHVLLLVAPARCAVEFVIHEKGHTSATEDHQPPEQGSPETPVRPPLPPKVPAKPSKPSPPPDPALLRRIAASKTLAENAIKTITAAYREELLLPTALKYDGDITEQQLEVLFEKCVTPGASIVVASTGGSITAGGGAHVGDANVYIHRLARHVAQLCPQAAVTTINAARGGTGSLTTGMCLTNLLGPRVDLLAVEFSLNDFEQYTVGGAFSAAPYELLLRAALTAYQHAPAVYSVYFWGQMFRHESAQEPHLAVARAYGVTGVSMRDVVWSALDARAAPYATKEAILADPKHHPNARVHNHLGDILALHLAQKLVRWADADGGALAGERRGAHRLLPFAPLRTPLAPELAAYDVAAHAFRCEIAGTPREGPAPALYEAAGWERFAMGARTDVRLDSQECVQATRTAAEGASLIIDVETAQGHVIISSCTKIGARTDPASFELRLLTPAAATGAAAGDDDDPEPVSTVLKLKPAVGRIGEAWRVEPLLPPGRHIIEVVPRGIVCPNRVPGAPPPPPATPPCTFGFFAVITL